MRILEKIDCIRCRSSNIVVKDCVRDEGGDVFILKCQECGKIFTDEEWRFEEARRRNLN